MGNKVYSYDNKIWGGGPLPGLEGARRDMHRKNYILRWGDHFQVP